MKRTLGLAMAAALTTSLVGTAAVAAPNENANDRAHEVAGQNNGKGKGPKKPPPGHSNPPEGRLTDVQLLQFSDLHGHLQPEGEFGGAAYLAGLIDQLRAEAPRKGSSYTVSSGDSIGGSTFMSGLFQDEPTIEILNAIGLTASAVGNHEFDEGYEEFARIVEGGNHPTLGQFGDAPYAGTDFPYLAANMVWEETGEPITAPYTVVKERGVRVGYIGINTADLPTLVSPAGIEGIDILDETETINRYAGELQDQGVQAIVVLLHEGGYTSTTYPDEITEASVNGCDDLSGKIVDINAGTDAAVDVIMTGHTHGAFICELPDPEGVNRMVTAPGDWGRVLTEVNLKIDRATKDVVRDRTEATNHLVTTDGPVNQEVAGLVDYWQEQADILAQQVVGQAGEAITGDASGDRGIETPMANLVADSILWGTAADGAQISFMNVGGVRASLDAGDITYEEAYEVLPFGNQLVTLDMTGAQIEAVLNQQYDPERSRPMLAFGVSEGFSYEWDAAANQVVSGSMTLNGEPLDPAATYKVSTLNFLADGGDGFTAFTEAGNLVGGPEDLANFVNYLRENSPVYAPEDRVAGL